MNKDEAREAAVRDSRDFRDRAVNQTLTLLFGNDTERRAFAKNTLASLFDMGASEQRRAASVDRRAIVEKAFEKGRASVVFEPHSAYRDKFRQMICEDDFDYTKIFCEVEYEGEKYANLSEDGADALADYFLGLMEQIDDQRSNDAELNRREAMDAVLVEMGGDNE